MKPTVSAIIPCYQAEPFLRDALDSVLEQTCPPLEVIVVDDGSTDKSVEIARSFGPPVRVIVQAKPKQGPGKARNRGWLEARGEWLAFLDADDLWNPQKLEKQLGAIDGPDVVLVHSNWHAFGARQFVQDFAELPAQNRYCDENFLRGLLPLNMSNILVRRSVAVRYPEWCYYTADTVFELDLARCGRFVLVPEVLSGTRYHRKSMSAAAGVYAQHVQVLDQWIGRHADELGPDRVAGLRDITLGRLVDMAWAAYWQRDWRSFHQQREYLRQYGSRPEIRELLQRRVYPGCLYKLKDAFDRLRGVRPARAEPGQGTPREKASEPEPISQPVTRLSNKIAPGSIDRSGGR